MTDAADLYRALLVSGRLSGLRRLTYRCDRQRQRCLLVDALDTPLGLVLHHVRYKYSGTENEKRSNASGRGKNTYDGENHWRERTYFAEESALADPDDDMLRLALTCDHVLDQLLSAPEFYADWNAGHTEVRVRADGSRYAVR
jgi:hypothetical protein